MNLDVRKGGGLRVASEQHDPDGNRRDSPWKSAAGVGITALAGLGASEIEAEGSNQRWDMSADFVTIGAGVAGLTGAVSALEHGASVIMAEENFDIGGHGMVGGGIVHL